LGVLGSVSGTSSCCKVEHRKQPVRKIPNHKHQISNKFQAPSTK